MLRSWNFQTLPRGQIFSHKFPDYFESKNVHTLNQRQQYIVNTSSDVSDGDDRRQHGRTEHEQRQTADLRDARKHGTSESRVRNGIRTETPSVNTSKTEKAGRRSVRTKLTSNTTEDHTNRRRRRRKISAKICLTRHVSPSAPLQQVR